MSDILIYFFVALGLSMDAFSLAIVYGVNKISYINMFKLSFCVGLFHFFMPIIGGNIGVLFQEKLALASNIIVSIVFFIIAFSMINSVKDEEKAVVLDKFIYFIVFAFTVSLDSLSVGVAYGILKENVLLSSLVFALVSFIFTFLGLIIGNIFGTKSSKTSKIVGAIILIFLALKYILL